MSMSWVRTPCAICQGQRHHVRRITGTVTQQTLPTGNAPQRAQVTDSIFQWVQDSTDQSSALDRSRPSDLHLPNVQWVQGYLVQVRNGHYHVPAADHNFTVFCLHLQSIKMRNISTKQHHQQPGTERAVISEKVQQWNGAKIDQEHII